MWRRIAIRRRPNAVSINRTISSNQLVNGTENLAACYIDGRTSASVSSVQSVRGSDCCSGHTRAVFWRRSCAASLLHLVVIRILLKLVGASEIG